MGISGASVLEVGSVGHVVVESALDELAVDLLDCCGHFASADVIKWVQETGSLPEQLDPNSQFGAPPVTVYHGDHFAIDVYFWRLGATGIHQHSFDGAFALLAESSLHCAFAFAGSTA